MTVLNGEHNFTTREEMYSAYSGELQFSESDDNHWTFGYVGKSQRYGIFAHAGDMM